MTWLTGQRNSQMDYMLATSLSFMIHKVGEEPYKKKKKKKKKNPWRGRHEGCELFPLIPILGGAHRTGQFPWAKCLQQDKHNRWRFLRVDCNNLHIVSLQDQGTKGCCSLLQKCTERVKTLWHSCCATQGINETGSRSPCMRPRSDPPNFGPMERCEKQTNNID